MSGTPASIPIPSRAQREHDDAVAPERALQFGRHGTLVGLLTTPRGGARRTPVVLLSGGIIHRVGPSRALVRIARALAAAGHPCLRFDLSAIGDSGRAPEVALQDAVVADIHDAITTLLAEEGGATDSPSSVALLGFCSGADNALFVAAEDARVQALVLFDPTVHKTAGFHRRELSRRLNSPEVFANLVSGRTIRQRFAALRSEYDTPFPPEHYGLLVSSAEDRDRRLQQLNARGARRLWVLGHGATSYCNAPEQVAESLPHGWDPALDAVAWMMELDHLLSTRGQVRRFIAHVRSWLREPRREALGSGCHEESVRDVQSTQGRSS